MITDYTDYKVETKYSARANPHRGYHDYETVIDFGATSWPTERQERTCEEIRKDLAKDSMWAYPAKKTGPNRWTISHGYDSGD